MTDIEKLAGLMDWLPGLNAYTRGSVYMARQDKRSQEWRLTDSGTIAVLEWLIRERDATADGDIGSDGKFVEFCVDVGVYRDDIPVQKGSTLSEAVLAAALEAAKETPWMAP